MSDLKVDKINLEESSIYEDEDEKYRVTIPEMIENVQNSSLPDSLKESVLGSIEHCIKSRKQELEEFHRLINQ